MNPTKAFGFTASSPTLLQVGIRIEVDAVATGLARIRPLQGAVGVEVLQGHVVAGVADPLDRNLGLDAVESGVKPTTRLI